jgi:hypothetical protein
VTALCLVCPTDRPQQPAPGLLVCGKHLERTRTHLTVIRDTAPRLSLIPVSKPGARRAPGFVSTAPANLDILVATDYRSGAGASAVRLRDPRDSSDTPTRSLPGALHHLAQWVREDANLPVPPEPPTFDRECGFLLSWLDWSAAREWFDDLADDLAELHTQIRWLAGAPRSRRLGTCPQTIKDGRCGATLYLPPDADQVHCRACGYRWDLLDLHDKIGA